METLITNFASGKRPYVAIIVIFITTILLSRSFECTCKSQVLDCSIYMVLPCMMIFGSMLWTNSSFKRICRYTCDGECHKCDKCQKFCCSLMRQFSKAFLVSLLWAAYLFFTGDWYVCCLSNLSNTTKEALLPCKDRWKLTFEERLHITELNNESKRYGYTLLLVVIVAGSCMSYFRFGKCCKKTSNCLDSNTTYYKLILEEEGMVRRELLRKKAKDKLTVLMTEMIANKRWEHVINAAKELIKREPNSPPDEKEDPGGAQLPDIGSCNSDRQHLLVKF